jgi:hypothetical protein
MKQQRDKAEHDISADILRKVALQSEVPDICFLFIYFHPETAIAIDQHVGSLE